MFYIPVQFFPPRERRAAAFSITNSRGRSFGRFGVPGVVALARL